MFKNLFIPKLKCTVEKGVKFTNCDTIEDCIALGVLSLHATARMLSLYYEKSLDECFDFLCNMSKSNAIEFKGINGMLKE